ncbi:hypothetical protein BQ8420_27330 [Nocardiopsis sp. JB363]|nr:hypothetical protein BQ8420_27330 [Nocardiopsis sp. JB363]
MAARYLTATGWTPPGRRCPLIGFLPGPPLTPTGWRRTTPRGARE